LQNTQPALFFSQLQQIHRPPIWLLTASDCRNAYWPGGTLLLSPLAPGQFLRPPCTAWGPYRFVLQTCPPFCPPRSVRPVDNSAKHAWSDSKVMRPSSHQAGTLRSKAGPETEKRSGYRRNAGSPNGQATRRKTGNAVKMVGTKKTNIECGITQVMQRRIGYPRYQGEPRKPPGDIGEPDVRQRKKWPLWSRTSKLRRSGRW
jgi:hypothetical protein